MSHPSPAALASGSEARQHCADKGMGWCRELRLLRPETERKAGWREEQSLDAEFGNLTTAPLLTPSFTCIPFVSAGAAESPLELKSHFKDRLCLLCT